MKQKNILVLLIMTFVTIFVWIGSNIYHIIVTSTVDEELQQQIIPINPNFDTNTIDKLKNRIKVEPIYELTQEQSLETNAVQEIQDQQTPSEGLQPMPEQNDSILEIDIDEITVTPELDIVPQVTNLP